MTAQANLAHSKRESKLICHQRSWKCAEYLANAVASIADHQTAALRASSLAVFEGTLNGHICIDDNIGAKMVLWVNGDHVLGAVLPM